MNHNTGIAISRNESEFYSMGQQINLQRAIAGRCGPPTALTRMSLKQLTMREQIAPELQRSTIGNVAHGKENLNLNLEVRSRAEAVCESECEFTSELVI